MTPFIDEGLRYLRRTQEGQAWVANLYANVFTEEHEAPAYGPERRTEGDPRLEPKDPGKQALSKAQKNTLERRRNRK